MHDRARRPTRSFRRPRCPVRGGSNDEQSCICGTDCACELWFGVRRIERIRPRRGSVWDGRRWSATAVTTRRMVAGLGPIRRLAGKSSPNAPPAASVRLSARSRIYQFERATSRRRRKRRSPAKRLPHGLNNGMTAEQMSFGTTPARDWKYFEKLQKL